ncbi:cupin domain-containing protein [Arthrobacter sp. NicSoilC5]|uniref:cupin domain-containing protein n=1 Tax=Arthrobacter sp. NicSoilC5 TaxID=2831000 RepID=UPI001CC4751E|nr:cupin domain-containing protein [Arthrobacter sp. NicSoilC5]BCW78255.1 hypothetical protein NicSoilC5_02740 [Arthrobacter sp. NicSoilC5]
MSTVLNASSAHWPKPVPVASERIIQGTPAASTVVLFTDDKTELGLWRVSPGEFTTVHQGYEEFISVLEGEGQLTHDDGSLITLKPGTVLILENGWRGRWSIDSTLVKSYATVRV